MARSRGVNVAAPAPFSLGAKRVTAAALRSVQFRDPRVTAAALVPAAGRV